MGRRTLVAMALAWVLVVTAVAAVTFVVVDRAGRGVGQASAARTVAPQPSGSTSPAATTGTGGPPTGSATPEPIATSSPSPAAPRTESFTTEGGTVVASCTGATLRLVSITPRDGWRFESGDSEVKFTGGEAEVELSLSCVRGVPIEDED